MRYGKCLDCTGCLWCQEHDTSYYPEENEEYDEDEEDG